MASAPVLCDSSFDMEPPSAVLGDAEEDALPPYTNNIRLATLCRRKREFHAAFDKTRRGRRTWEIIWLVLDGTALRVYKPQRDERMAFESTETIGLNRTSSGDSTRSNLRPIATLPGIRLGRTPTPATRPPIIAGVARSLPTSFVISSEPQLHIIRSIDLDLQSHAPPPSPSADERHTGHRRVSSIVKGSSLPPPPFQYPIVTARSNPRSAPTPVLAGPALRAIEIETPDFSIRKSSRQYHLQYAVCMTADAYTKREHVLRFIFADGKQFLVQLSNRAEAVAWLQLMSVAAPLSLDLDERPMPEPAHYPRRRPRTRANRRPSTAPGALERDSRSQADAAIAELPSTTPAMSVNLRGASLDVEVVEDTADIEEEDAEDGLEMDHLPPPRRPQLVHSLSSVEQARRMGIQV